MHKKSTLILLFCVLLASSGWSQNMRVNIDSIKPPATYDHIYSMRIYGDTLVTSFLMFIKDEVKLHFHDEHSEHIYVLDGTATMTVDGKNFKVKKGDFIFIPMQQRHSVKVTSPKPLKVLSIQAPWFDGKDRLSVK